MQRHLKVGSSPLPTARPEAKRVLAFAQPGVHSYDKPSIRPKTAIANAVARIRITVSSRSGDQLRMGIVMLEVFC